ncbi:MAG: OmpA family protein [Bacteroidetes bacterium]|nr:MAG: OmpA family protein [Bacteroidota bacterium]
MLALRILLIGITLCFISLQGLQAQEVTLVKSVFFGGGSYYIDPAQIEEVKAFIEQAPGGIARHQVVVSSHTDNIGGAAYNQWLSGMRSETVSGVLHKLGLSPDQILIQNNGQQNPYYDNQTLHGRLANRRVDIILLPIVL